MVHARRARMTPSRSTSSPASRTPAVSMNSSRSPSMSAVSVTKSRVVPGAAVTMARLAPTSALNKLDLPTFGLPAIATRAPSRISRPRLNSHSSVVTLCSMAASAPAASPASMK